jgi:hypothetical protein
MSYVSDYYGQVKAGDLRHSKFLRSFSLIEAWWDFCTTFNQQPAVEGDGSHSEQN